MPTVERGCGKRKQGGVYVEVESSPTGRDLEWFMCDPPFEPPAEWGLKSIGVSLVPDPERNTHHILDWVGEEHYPDIAGFLEEVRAHGLSRRLARNTKFELLNERSNIMLVHRKAMILNWSDWAGRNVGGELKYGACPKRLLAWDNTGVHGGPKLHVCRPGTEHWLGHIQEGEQCAGIWYRDLNPETGEEPGQHVNRLLHSGIPWAGNVRPDVTPVYSPAVFLVMPAKRFAVIREEGNDEETANTVLTVRQAMGAKVTLEDE